VLAWLIRYRHPVSSRVVDPVAVLGAIATLGQRILELEQEVTQLRLVLTTQDVQPSGIRDDEP